MAMYMVENVVSYLLETNSAWLGFQNIQISEVVETTYSSMGTNKQTSETLPRQSGQLCPNFSDGPWTLVRFFIDKILPEDFDLDRVFGDSGITVKMIPYVVEYKHPGSYEHLVDTSCLGLLSEKFHDFKLIVD